MRHRLAIVGICAGVALAVSACGGGTTATSTSTTTPSPTSKAPADPVKWAGATCTGFGGSIKALLAVVKQGMEQPDADTATQKVAMVAFLDTVAKSYAQAETELKALGSPSADKDALHKELLEYFGTTAKGLADAKVKFEAIDPKDPEFETKTESLGSDFMDPKGLTENMKKVSEDPKLKEAYETAPACVELKKTALEMGSLFGGQ